MFLHMVWFSTMNLATSSLDTGHPFGLSLLFGSPHPGLGNGPQVRTCLKAAQFSAHHWMSSWYVGLLQYWNPKIHLAPGLGIGALVARAPGCFKSVELHVFSGFRTRPLV